MPSGDSMEAQDVSSQEPLAGDVMDSLGEGKDAATEMDSQKSNEAPSEDIDYAKALSSAKKRLKAQSISHEREIRDLHARVADLQQRFPEPNQQSQETNFYGNQEQPGGVDEQIHKAVSYALNHRDMEERKAKAAQEAAHVQKQYKELYKHLDTMGDKYDDFHDVVFNDETHFTPALRDYAMTLPRTGNGSAGEVLYNLGKNPEELQRIAKLHPIDQATEMAKLSHALISGGEPKSSSSRPLGQIKTNPVSNSHVITEKTPIGSIRSRMKSGTWK